MRSRLAVLLVVECAALALLVGVITACNSSDAPGDATTPPGDSSVDSNRPPTDGAPGDSNAGDSGATDAAMDGGGSDAGMTEGVPVFVAHGYAGRTTVSCDDGRSWTADQSLDDGIRCFGDSGPDCDHHPGRAKGIVYSHGWFVATYGWGPPGSVQRSQDGVTWESTLDGETFGGIGVSATHIMLGARNARFSDDDGASWGEPSSSMLEGWNVRRAGFADHDGGRFILVGDGGDLTISSDEGATWWRPTTVPEGCGAGIQNNGGVAYQEGVILILGGDGSACRSDDGGDTFTMHDTGAGRITSSEIVVTEGRFMAWGEQARWDSADGASWTRTPLSPGVDIGAVERGPSGTFVAVNSGWNRWYDQQRFYRSTDGISWDELPAGNYAGGHPIHQIRFGYAAPSSACPAP